MLRKIKRERDISNRPSSELECDCCTVGQAEYYIEYTDYTHQQVCPACYPEERNGYAYPMPNRY